MIRTLLKSKIHRARVTDANLHYEGSVTIDRLLMDAADIRQYEQIDVYDITNGARLTTYAIPGEAGSGTICINGAAAHLVHPGDLVILATYAHYDDSRLHEHTPAIIRVDERNQWISDKGTAQEQAAAKEQAAGVFFGQQTLDSPRPVSPEST